MNGQWMKAACGPASWVATPSPISALDARRRRRLHTLGLADVSRKSPPITWGILAGGSAVLGIRLVHGAGSKACCPGTTWALLGAVAAAALLAAVWFRRGKIAASDANLTAGILAIGSAGLLLFAEDRLLNGVWLTIGMAALAAAYAFSTRSSR